jgi:phosphoglycolate phosphatase
MPYWRWLGKHCRALAKLPWGELMLPATIVFDLDGTLIHSAPDIVATTNELMKRYRRTPLDEKVIVEAIGEGLMQLVYDCFPDARGDQRQLDLIAEDFAAIYEENLLRRTTVFDGINEFLEAATQLESPTKRKIAIVTNKRIAWTERTLTGLKLDRFPWVRVFGADSLSERKPHPLPLLEAMKAAKVKPENTVMVGDGLPDMKASVRAGIHSIGCAYGYCAAEKLTKAGASMLIQSPHDLAQALEAAARLPPRIETP